MKLLYAVIYRIRSVRFIPKIIFLLVLTVLVASVGAQFSLHTKQGLGGAFTTGFKSKGVTERPEVELITLTPDGFVPAEIKRTSGKFLLVVDDRSGLTETFLRLDLATGIGSYVRLKERSVKRIQSNWSEVQILSTGDYLLTEANHPTWRCKLTVTN